jgi:hypothetical protein
MNTTSEIPEVEALRERLLNQQLCTTGCSRDME